LRRRRHAVHENHERWLVSYADFITLLFAFFVVMFATAQNDKTKMKEVSESVRNALRQGQVGAALANVLHLRRSRPNESRQDAGTLDSAGSRPGPLSQPDLAKSLEILNRELENEITTGKMQVKLETRGLVISLREAAFFASGDDTVDPGSYPIIEKVAAVVKALPNPVRLEGHTDSVPIHNSRFRSNWELSAARSIAMLELLSERFGVPRPRMAVAGYAENAPADTNDTEEGRAHNRRVDVVVLATDAARSEPAAKTAGE